MRSIEMKWHLVLLEMRKLIRSDAFYVHFHTACLAVQQLHICACMHSIVTRQDVWLLQSMKVLVNKRLNTA